jgi:hypothetical protein
MIREKAVMMVHSSNAVIQAKRQTEAHELKEENQRQFRKEASAGKSRTGQTT